MKNFKEHSGGLLMSFQEAENAVRELGKAMNAIKDCDVVKNMKIEDEFDFKPCNRLIYGHSGNPIAIDQTDHQ